jgi:hypothetical protein
MPRPLVLVIVGVAALALTEAVRAMARLLGRRSPMVATMGRRAHRSFQFLTVALALDITLRNQGWHGRWPHVAIHLLDILAIVSGGWAVAILLFVVQDAALGWRRTDTRDNRMARGLQMAFGKALLLDDVMVVEGEWGRVEEMTLTYGCLVREWLVAWLREHHPHALPRLRTQVPGRERPR